MGEITIIPPTAPPSERVKTYREGQWRNSDDQHRQYISAKARLTKFVRAKSFKAIQEVNKIMLDQAVPPAVRLAAAQVIIERAFGKATQPVEVTDQGRTLEDMLRELWDEHHASHSNDLAIEPASEPSE